MLCSTQAKYIIATSSCCVGVVAIVGLNMAGLALLPVGHVGIIVSIAGGFWKDWFVCA